MISSSRRKARCVAGFTLIELLVVIGIIALLAAVLLPAVNHAYKVAQRTRMAADLQVISQALNAYKNDFGDYPRVTAPAAPGMSGTVPGAVLLCWALVAPGTAVPPPSGKIGADGNDGPGFRTRGTTGKVWGPYLPPDRFQVSVIVGASGSQQFTQPAQVFDDWSDILTDRNGNPIFYYPGAKNVQPTQPGGFISKYLPGTTPAPSVFNFEDNDQPYMSLQSTIDTIWHLNMMRFRMGDMNCDGTIGTGESAIATGPYLLWCCGPDNQFGTDDDVVDNGQSLQINSATATAKAMAP
ncbi:MAG TPA: prepilin-type N-terminal cleavage/methylation domain-containing protein [Tepidisphaeraceae bacterium]|nr:prepilin-type N-terminal cleavage/methylation domain-containing protein [Tepidisphaeraceae bacterium]